MARHRGGAACETARHCADRGALRRAVRDAASRDRFNREGGGLDSGASTFEGGMKPIGDLRVKIFADGADLPTMRQLSAAAVHPRVHDESDIDAQGRRRRLPQLRPRRARGGAGPAGVVRSTVRRFSGDGDRGARDRLLGTTRLRQSARDEHRRAVVVRGHPDAVAERRAGECHGDSHPGSGASHRVRAQGRRGLRRYRSSLAGSPTPVAIRCRRCGRPRLSWPARRRSS